MDYLRVLLVPFHPTILLMAGIFAVLITALSSGGYIGIFGILFIQIWVFKYCYVLIEQLADGAREPPVMDMEMLSPLETRPWIQAALYFGGGWFCYLLGGSAGFILAAVLIALLPATVAILGLREPFYQTVNPLIWVRVIRSFGPYYFLLLAALALCVGVVALAWRLDLWGLIRYSIALWCEVAFFSLVGSCIYLRRIYFGHDPGRTPERAANRAEMERMKLRAKMVDDVFQQVRLGRHVDATAPLAIWLRDLDADYATRDSLFVAEQALGWDSLSALNTIGSTLIRHLLRFGRPDSALSVFQMLRARSANFTMDSAADLRTLAEYAEAQGKEELAQSMRLETPVLRPKT